MITKRFDSVLRIVILVCSIIMGLGYLCYLGKQLFFFEGILPLAVSIAVLLLLGGWQFFQKKLYCKNAKWYRILSIILAVALLFYTLSFLFMCAVLIKTNLHDCVRPEDTPKGSVVIVFGAKIKGDEPGSTLRRRLEKALEIMQNDETSVCIVSGGQGYDEEQSEASVMAAYLQSRGIASGRILMDEKSGDTIENIDHSLELIKYAGWEERALVCVSTDFHLARIRMLLHWEGKDEITLVSAPSPADGYTGYSSCVREYMSYVKIFLYRLKTR